MRIGRFQRVSARRGLLVLNFTLNAFGLGSLGASWAGVNTVSLFLAALVFFIVAEGALGLVIWDYHKELDAKLKPQELADKVNGLRRRARDLSAGPSSDDDPPWPDQCGTFFDECMSLIRA